MSIDESSSAKELDSRNISEIIIEKGIKSREELLIFAKDQKD
jgi:hypothetical protein